MVEDEFPWKIGILSSYDILTLDVTALASRATFRNLGVVLDQDTSFKSSSHIKQTSGTDFFLSENDAEKLAHSFVTSRLDYYREASVRFLMRFTVDFEVHSGPWSYCRTRTLFTFTVSTDSGTFSPGNCWCYFTLIESKLLHRQQLLFVFFFF